MLVRHPIYSGILVAGVGTAVALSWLRLIAVALAGVYFVYSAKVGEHYLTEQCRRLGVAALPVTSSGWGPCPDLRREVGVERAPPPV